MEDGAPGGRMDEGDQIAPLVAVLDWGERALTGQAPDLLEDGLESDAVFVVGPDLHAGLGEGGSDLAD
jgi:hypothetical protein